MSKIQTLPDNLINLIAAGEVVERPASVVKELLENSIDAGADRIIVTLKSNGLEEITVEDNGSGIEDTDIDLVFKQHSTSKVKTQSDLESISSLGFRGEALASISSVSERISLETKTEDSNGILLEKESSHERRIISQSTKTGTKISIFNLFKNIPARKKFLKSPATELKHITSTFTNLALIHLDTHFELVNNGKTLYKLTKTKNISDRLFEIYGKPFSKDTLNSHLLHSNGIDIQIITSTPESATKSTPIQLTYVNGRYVQDKVTFSAIKQAFKGFIHKDLKPNFLVILHMDPKLVDVNVHPRKLEVKFENSSQIFQLVYNTAKQMLESYTKNLVLDKVGSSFYTNDDNLTNSSFSYNPKGQKHNFVKDSTNSTNTYSKKQQIQHSLNFTKELLSGAGQRYDNDTTIDQSNIIQIFDTYIVFERNNSVLMIDQHAAAEKILFEKLISQNEQVATKKLLVPEVVELKNEDKEKLLEIKDTVKKIGVVIEDFGQNSIQITEVPELISAINVKELLLELLNPPIEFQKTYEEFSIMNSSVSEKIYYKIATMACHGSIRAGQKLQRPEMIQIIQDLIKLDLPYNCPHGRPVYWEISKPEIEKNFKRII